ncbi:prokineticin Bm8-d-like [Branchiostoma lanceolatum]|uniref:prokineticin Bm8-d-like n=1 Tax=Branchiostoma lanceolatum TaxID=7740 RepID=UPI00345707A3
MSLKKAIVLVLVINAVVQSFTFGLVLTGVCTGDAVCRVEWGNNHCCALWNQGSAMTVCKPLGAPGEQCHLASNRTPYPTENRRRFWRCPCRNGLRCTRSSSDSQVGVCRRT